MEKHIHFAKDALRLELLDQSLLPGAQAVYICTTAKDVGEAIRSMVVRGAPAIGVAAAWGCVLAAGESLKAVNWRDQFRITTGQLASSRPTAVNLAWAVRRMVQKAASLDENNLLPGLIAEAEAIQYEDEEICRKIGQYGASLIASGNTILTYCNAGALATSGYGTALGVVRAAFEQGKKIQVIACETRPLLQGARLTAYELAADGIPVKIICDNSAALLMANNKIQIVITGADHIAANGDTANKIGTFGLAIMAKELNVPFYIAAPCSTINPGIASGRDIPIEQRDSWEVLQMRDKRIAPEGVEAINYAFDLTPAKYINGIITEKGLLKPPFGPAIERIFADAKNAGHKP